MQEKPKIRYDLPPWCPQDKAPKVCAAMIAINRDIDYISKDRKNVEQKYSFRGIDDVMNALHGLTVKHGVTTRPVALSRTQGERETKSGTRQVHTVVEMEIWVTDEDGASAIIGPVFGEALDTSDKSTNKALSFGYKYGMILTFSIPTEEIEDGDSESPELGRRHRPDEPPIGEKKAEEIYNAFGQHGVTRSQIIAKVGKLDAAPVSLIDTLKAWRDEIAKNKNAAVRIFGDSAAQSRTDKLNGPPQGQ